ncbi:hypothetical protein D3C77_237080 [compost metagenome]
MFFWVGDSTHPLQCHPPGSKILLPIQTGHRYHLLDRPMFWDYSAHRYGWKHLPANEKENKNINSRRLYQTLADCDRKPMDKPIIPN